MAFSESHLRKTERSLGVCEEAQKVSSEFQALRKKRDGFRVETIGNRRLTEEIKVEKQDN